MNNTILLIILGLFFFACKNENTQKIENQESDSLNYENDSIMVPNSKTEQLVKIKQIKKDTNNYFPKKEDLISLYPRNITSGLMNKLSFICLPQNQNYKHAFINIYQNFEIDAVVYTSYTKYGWSLKDTTMIINAIHILKPTFKLMDRLPIKIGDNISSIDKSKIDTILTENIQVAKYHDCMIAFKIDSDTIFRMFIWKPNYNDTLLDDAYDVIPFGLNETIYPNDD